MKHFSFGSKPCTVGSWMIVFSQWDATSKNPLMRRTNFYNSSTLLDRVHGHNSISRFSPPKAGLSGATLKG